MCLAIPAKVLKVDQHDDTAVVSIDGVSKEVSTVLLDDVAPDDYVLVHVGFALATISEEEAVRTLDIFEQAGRQEASG